MEKIRFENRILVLGYGAVARATLPLISNHFEVTNSQIAVVSKPGNFEKGYPPNGSMLLEVELTRENYEELLSDLVEPGDLLVNLTAEVSSIDLAKYCARHHILYLDTCIEMWRDETTPESKTYDGRQQLLELKRELPRNSSTILSSIGANPGIVSLLTKRLIIQISEELGIQAPAPLLKREWAERARELTVRVIHVNERDTQHSYTEVGEKDFFSTWSVPAMIMESIEPAEMAIGSHEDKLPANAKYCGNENRRDIFFEIPGKDLLISTWLPLAGEIEAMILNHNEPYSIAELYAIEDEDDNYWPTVCFAYRPSDQTMESLKSLTVENHRDRVDRLLLNDIEGGRDELGVFMMTEAHGSYWLGSRLDIRKARDINPDSSATSLQVAAGVVAGMCWVVSSPSEGVVEPEDIIDFDYVLSIAEPYWDGFVFKRTDWRPDDTSVPTLGFERFIQSE